MKIHAYEPLLTKDFDILNNNPGQRSDEDSIERAQNVEGASQRRPSQQVVLNGLCGTPARYDSYSIVNT